MTDDRLSEVFGLVEIRGLLSGGFAVRGPWVSRSAIENPVKLIAMVRGRSRLTADGVDGPIELESGDVAILNHRSWLRLEGGAGDGPPRDIEPPVGNAAMRLDDADDATDIVVGGHIDLNPAGRALLQHSLPAVGHVHGAAATATSLRSILDRLLQESTSDRLGSAFAIRQYGQLMILEVLRTYVEQAELPPGWLRLLTDERLRPALRLMHTEPEKSWRLEELARATAMSRTSFAEHFRTVAGTPPLTYLNRWRMLLAQHALRDGDDVRVGSLASELGYASESTFSTAFKREVGESPLRYRFRTRDELQDHAEPAPG